MFATSGTSGKNSFLNQTAKDIAFSNKVTVPKSVAQDRSRPVFVLGPRKAPNRASATFSHMVDVVGRPDAVYFLTDAELRISDLSAMARMRRRIGDGTATPSEIAEFEAGLKLRRDFADQMLDGLIDKILAHRDEPMLLVGLTPQLFRVVEAAQERGIPEGSFHPDTHVLSGGGAKGFDLPANHVEQIMQFMGLTLDNFTQGYGMQEASSGGRMNEWGRYEFPGWIIPLLLDERARSCSRPVAARSPAAWRFSMYPSMAAGAASSAATVSSWITTRVRRVAPFPQSPKSPGTPSWRVATTS